MLFMIVRKDCPYCAEAGKNLKKIRKKYPVLQKIPLTILREEMLSAEYDYYYTPVFFWNREKISEGEYTEKALFSVLKKAYAFYQIKKDESSHADKTI